MSEEKEIILEAKKLTVAYGHKIIQSNLNFQVYKGDIFVIMGPSGCGKSSLLKTIMGLNEALRGDVFYWQENFTEASKQERESILAKTGALFQGGALFSSRTLAENIALPLKYYTEFDAETIADLVSLKLALVNLAGYENYYPAEISGGMRKRAALARALALDPELLFLDEPSAGLDPITANKLDDLLLELAQSLNMTLVIVTHDLDSIFKVASRCLYLDNLTRTMLALGTTKELLTSAPEDVYNFLQRGKERR